MRKLLIIIFLANIILIIVSLIILPSEVAIHFGRGGIPNSWASKEFNALVLFAIELPLFVLFFFAPYLTLKIPSKLISLPNKNYWLREENRPKAGEKLSSLISEFGFALFAFMFCIALLTIEANLANPVRLNESIFFPIFIAFMIYTVYWCVKIILSFKAPKEK